MCTSHVLFGDQTRRRLEEGASSSDKDEKEKAQRSSTINKESVFILHLQTYEPPQLAPRHRRLALTERQNSRVKRRVYYSSRPGKQYALNARACSAFPSGAPRLRVEVSVLAESQRDYFSSSVDLSFCSVLLGGPLRFSRVNIRIERWPGEEGGRPGSWFKLFCASAAA